MVYPLHRWKSFWLGILVLAFLGWSWMASMGHPGGIGISIPGVNGGAAYTNGRMILFCNESSGRFGIGFFSEPVAPEPTWFPSGVESQCSESKGIYLTNSSPTKKSWMCGYSPAHGHIRVAHWLLIPSFLLLWSAFLLWRIRRMKRLEANSEHRTPNSEL